MTPVSGISYYLPPAGAYLSGLDGKINISLEGTPIPLLEEDFAVLGSAAPSYDVVGRGLYHLLRVNPEALSSLYFAQLLQEAYPHYLSELASHIVMLDQKDVEVTYLDRKINYLKIFALIEPENAQFLFEIGRTFLDKGLRFSALHMSTVSLYRALDFLRKALQLSSGHMHATHTIGEVCYLLGKYDEAKSHWYSIQRSLDTAEAENLAQRLSQMEAGELPLIPVVDYLEAIAVALSLFEKKQYEESAAIFQDIIDDNVFCGQFAMPEIYYYLALCYKALNMPRYAEDYLNEALRIEPSFAEARSALDNL